MKTKVTGPTLILDAEILEQAGIRQGDEVEVSADGNGIVVTPADHAARDAEFRASAEKITAKYAGLFERLSK